MRLHLVISQTNLCLVGPGALVAFEWTWQSQICGLVDMGDFGMVSHTCKQLLVTGSYIILKQIKTMN